MYNQSPPLVTIRDWMIPLTAQERTYICTTLINTIKNYYVHLPIKEKGFAINPVEELRLLEAADYDDDNQMSFLRDVQNIFLKLNDRHTTLVMPEPWSNLVAFIPLIIEMYYENDVPVYIITKKLFDYENEEMPYGLRVTHWNGVEIHRYIESLSQTSQGANIAAALKLALASLTVRSLAYSFPPEEDWVVLSCVNELGEIQTFSFPWRVYYNAPKTESTTNKKSGVAKDTIGNTGQAVSLDTKALTQMKFKKQFFGKPLVKKEVKQHDVLQSYGDILKYGTITTTSGDTGYLRIFSFEVGNVNTFISEISDILQSLPQEKLIIDIRENPGGIIPSGEQLVQLLTEQPITTSPVSFRNTSSTKALGNIEDFSRWKRSMDLMEETGEIFSQHYSLSQLNDLPAYRYPGKVALIIDSLVYSTSDFVAADFKDNNIGPIIGVDPRTGGGGANVWSYQSLVYYAQKVGNIDIGLLPKGIGLNVAMRRSIHTGIDEGLPVEDLGTKADVVYKITMNDLLYDNIDLLNFTAAQLS